MQYTLFKNYKKDKKKLLLTTHINERYAIDDLSENWFESFKSNVLKNVDDVQDPFIQQLILSLDYIQNVSRITNIGQLIQNCQPKYFEILLIFLVHAIDNQQFEIQDLLDFDLVFGPLIGLARISFFELPQNTNSLICFFRDLILNQYFYEFFLQTPCIETPFDFISLLYSDAAHDINEQEREQFDASLMANCISLIGDFFNYDLIIDLPQLENSVSYLLYNIKCPNSVISYSAIEGAIKALLLSPQNAINMIFEDKIFFDLLSILSNDEDSNDYRDTFDANENIIDQEKVQISILNLIYLIIKYDEQNQYSFQIMDLISDELHMLMQKSEIFQIKALKILVILSQSFNFDEPNPLIKLEATSDSIQFLTMDYSYNLKILSLQYFTSLMKFPDYQFFKQNMIIFDYINQLICSLSLDDLTSFVQSMRILMNLFHQRNDDSLNDYLIQIGFVEELSSLANSTDEDDMNEIGEIVNFISSF